VARGPVGDETIAAGHIALPAPFRVVPSHGDLGTPVAVL